MSKPATKQIVLFVLRRDDDEFPETIAGAIRYLQAVLESVPAECRESARFDLENGWGGDAASITGEYDRMETDDERRAREQYESRRLTEFKAYELSELARLKAKYPEASKR